MRYDPLNDSISSVEMITYMGSDLMVVNAARVSMAKESEWELFQEDERSYPVRVLSEKDKKLISYLAKHKHWTPFSHPQVQFRIKMPIFVARQWFKHMIGFTRNEVSRRYVDDVPEFYQPRIWRGKAENVKQGSSDIPVPINPKWIDSIHEDALEAYTTLLGSGVAPEMARMVLPQSMYTEFIETGSLAAYARLANLRLDPHAQKEAQKYAEAISSNLAELFPVSWEALRNA